MYGWSHVLVRFTLWGFASEINAKILIFWEKTKCLNFLTFLMDGWYQIPVRFALWGLVSKINAKNLILDIFEKKVKFWIFWNFSCMGDIKFWSVFRSTRLSFWDKCKKKWTILRKSNFFIFLMHGWYQITVRFALQGLVSEINSIF